MNRGTTGFSAPWLACPQCEQVQRVNAALTADLAVARAKVDELTRSRQEVLAMFHEERAAREAAEAHRDKALADRIPFAEKYAAEQIKRAEAAEKERDALRAELEHPTQYILRHWKRERIEAFALHVLGSEHEMARRAANDTCAACVDGWKRGHTCGRSDMLEPEAPLAME
jgi:thioesterase domain-containing protein